MKYIVNDLSTAEKIIAFCGKNKIMASYSPHTNKRYIIYLADSNSIESKIKFRTFLGSFPHETL